MVCGLVIGFGLYLARIAVAMANEVAFDDGCCIVGNTEAVLCLGASVEDGDIDTEDVVVDSIWPKVEDSCRDGWIGAVVEVEGNVEAAIEDDSCEGIIGCTKSKLDNEGRGGISRVGLGGWVGAINLDAGGDGNGRAGVGIDWIEAIVESWIRGGGGFVSLCGWVGASLVDSDGSVIVDVVIDGWIEATVVNDDNGKTWAVVDWIGDIVDNDIGVLVDVDWIGAAVVDDGSVVEVDELVELGGTDMKEGVSVSVDGWSGVIWFESALDDGGRVGTENAICGRDVAALSIVDEDKVGEETAKGSWEGAMLVEVTVVGKGEEVTFVEEKVDGKWDDAVPVDKSREGKGRVVGGWEGEALGIVVVVVVVVGGGVGSVGGWGDDAAANEVCCEVWCKLGTSIEDEGVVLEIIGCCKLVLDDDWVLTVVLEYDIGTADLNATVEKDVESTDMVGVDVNCVDETLVIEVVEFKFEVVWIAADDKLTSTVSSDIIPSGTEDAASFCWQHVHSIPVETVLAITSSVWVEFSV